MTQELKEYIVDTIFYYSNHQVDTMIKTHPGFVAEDFATLLNKLEVEL